MTDDIAKQNVLNEALYWIRAAERQLSNFVESLLSVAESGVKDAMPAVADGHFLLIAAAQADKSLKDAGCPMDPKIAFAIRKLRDVHEHWEQHKDSFSSDDLPKAWSGRDFADTYPGALPWRYAIDATGTWISTLRLEDLWQELLSKEAQVGSMIEAQVVFSKDQSRPFPRRESRILGFVMLTQNVTIKTGPAPQEPEST